MAQDRTEDGGIGEEKPTVLCPIVPEILTKQLNQEEETISNPAVPSASSSSAISVSSENEATISNDDPAIFEGMSKAQRARLRKRLRKEEAETQEEERTQKKINMRKDEQVKLGKMTEACRVILECIGEDPEREGLCKTPERWAKALLFLNHGYKKSVEEVTNEAVFEEDHREMVVVRDIDIHSLCEHHMLPFTGKVHVGYIPNGKILGLSKIARIAEVFARRLQVQERLTTQIADALVDAVSPLGVGVVVECSHFCMVMRGVQKSGSTTVSSSVRGCFETDPKTRAEFFSLINNRPR
eukprot:CAMPEP_0172524124 /NCGR_PEP_ID=MMETSP1066-20121228/294024_1 /TAXON_ID=671091 /ORGANISM="Coscinodiscus wailesii, Strain CCMP2513" /LENGTH=297 /DNA_ID=CAMNT_0013307235 /DNA_START=50 /DNA_END=946 /DNA_ORIENTATION=-